MTEVPVGFRWPHPWKPFPPPDGWTGRIASVDDELRSEVGPGHPLHGVRCRAVGYSVEHPDEYLFVTERPYAPVVFVHLTHRAETDPKWPYSVAYPSWEAFRSAWDGDCSESRVEPGT